MNAIEIATGLVNANTWQDRRDLCLEHFDLLHLPEVLRFLEFNAIDERHKPTVRRSIAARIGLTALSRSQMEALFADYENMSDLVFDFINAGSMAEREHHFLSHRNELCGPGADQFFADLLMQDRDAQELQFIEDIWDLLIELRDRSEGGADAPTPKRSPVSAASLDQAPLFVDSARLSFYLKQLLEDESGSEHVPCWNEELASPAEDLDFDRIADLLAILEEREWLMRCPVGTADHLVTTDVLTERGVFRLETLRATRVVVPQGDNTPSAFWWVEDSRRVLCLWEDSRRRDFLPHRSSDHTLIDRFHQFHLEPLMDSGVSLPNLFALGLDENALAVFSKVGFIVEYPRTVTLLYRVDHVCHPLTNQPTVTATLGAPIVVWDAATQVHYTDSGALLAPLDAFLACGRWSESQALLESEADTLFDPAILDLLSERIDACGDPGEGSMLEEKRNILSAAHRFGLVGAYAYAQGFGRGGTVIPNETIAKLEIAETPEQLQDLFDREPILAQVYRKMIGQEESTPYPPPNPPAALQAAMIALGTAFQENDPSRIVEVLTPHANTFDPRLYPGIYGAVRTQLGIARTHCDRSDEGLAHAMQDFDAASAVFTEEAYPLDRGEIALSVAQALMERGHPERALGELESANELLDPRALEDSLRCTVAPRTEDEIVGLCGKAQLLTVEALWRAGRSDEAEGPALEAERRLSDTHPELAARACLLLTHLSEALEGRDPDEQVEIAEAAARRGLEYMDDDDYPSDVSLRLEACLAHALIRPEAYRLKERTNEAKERLERALAHAEPDSSAYAELLLVQHEYLLHFETDEPGRRRAQVVAQKLLDWAIQHHDDKAEAEANTRLGDSAAPGEESAFYRRAAELFRKLGADDDCAANFRRMGDRCFERREWSDAISAYEAARSAEPRLQGDALDALARSSKTSGAFPRAAWAAYALGDYDQAFRLANEGKARFLRQLAQLPVEPTVEILEILKPVSESTVLVMPIVTSHGTLTFVVPGDTRKIAAEHVFEKAENANDWRELLASWMQAYFEYTEHQDIEAWDEVISDICERCWTSMMAGVSECLTALDVAAGSPVLFVPPSLLAPLPFHAARTPDGAHPFSDNHLLTYAPGLGLLPSVRETNDGRVGKVLALIDPSGDLPFSRYELQALQRLVSADMLRAFSSQDATTDRFFEHASGCAQLHFACHGRHHWARSHETGIQLAGANGLGAFSFLQEDVDLTQTKLVTLSACETGITTAFRRLFGNTLTQGGEEYMGLAGALHAAGVECVISTLWPVEDYVATLFIENFYRLQLGKGLDFFSALAGARRELRQLTARDAIEDIRRRLQEDGLSELLTQYLEGIETLLAKEYASDDNPFDNPGCWAPYVLSGSPA